MFEELSKQERLEMRNDVKGINYQIEPPGSPVPQPGLNIKAPHGLNRAEPRNSEQILLLEASVPGNSDNEVASAPLQFPEVVIQSFQHHWKADSHSKPCVFAVIDPAASANGYFEQLKVSDPALLRAELQKCNITWRGGRVAYIGAMIFNDAEKLPIEKLLKATEPPVEPVLSLIINVDYGVPHHHQMMLPLFMRNVHKPEASLSCQL